MANWTKTNDYYNREIITQDVWSRKCRRGKVYLIDKAPFTYTFCCGANSDFSHTGCFYRCIKITTVQEAMDALDKIIPVWLEGNGYGSVINKYK